MILVDESRCPKNHPCPSIGLCPVDAIIQDDIFSAPRIDQEKCIACGACTSACRAFVEVEDPVEAATLAR
jgi:Fe-S-cluster-containing hydrogenase component 2